MSTPIEAEDLLWRRLCRALINARAIADADVHVENLSRPTAGSELLGLIREWGDSNVDAVVDEGFRAVSRARAKR